MVSTIVIELQCQHCSVFGWAAGEYFQKWSMTLFLFGRCKQSGIKSHNNPAYNPRQTESNSDHMIH
jgi:hypothetical protein